MIYFVQGKKTKKIKIGFTRICVSERISKLQTGSADILIFLGACPGDKKYEKDLHRKFSNQRQFGEWFNNSDDILFFIKEKCVKNESDIPWVASMISSGFLTLERAKKMKPEDLSSLSKRYHSLLASRTKFK